MAIGWILASWFMSGVAAKAPREFPLNGEELRSTFGNNREPNKWHLPNGATSELYGALLEDLGPASAPSSWVDPPDSFSFTMLAKTGDPSMVSFQVMPAVPHALRVNDACQRRPFLRLLGRSFHRR